MLYFVMQLHFWLYTHSHILDEILAPMSESMLYTLILLLLILP